MKTFYICVETGPTGNDFFYHYQDADTLEEAIRIAEPLARAIHNGRRIQINPAGSGEVMPKVKVAKKLTKNTEQKKMKKLKKLDVVRTKFGTIAVVAEVGAGGRVSLVLPKKSSQKVAWYEPKELELVAPVTAMARWWALG